MIVGVVNRVKWTLETDESAHGVDMLIPDDVLELQIPLGYDVLNMSIVEKFTRGRFLISFPSN